MDEDQQEDLWSWADKTPGDLEGPQRGHDDRPSVGASSGGGLGQQIERSQWRPSAESTPFPDQMGGHPPPDRARGRLDPNYENVWGSGATPKRNQAGQNSQVEESQMATSREPSQSINPDSGCVSGQASFPVPQEPARLARERDIDDLLRVIPEDQAHRLGIDVGF